MAKLTTSLKELWNNVDMLQRTQPPNLVEMLLKILLSSKTITNDTNIFLFDSLPLFGLGKSDRNSHFGRSTMIPLIVQAGLADYFFKIPSDVPSEYKELIDHIHKLFFVGPNDFDIKIENLGLTHWETILNWFQTHSDSQTFNEEKNEWYFANSEIWKDAKPTRFPEVELVNKIETIQHENSIPVVKASIIDNIDGHHDSKINPENQLFVICLELGFCPSKDKSMNQFSPIATIHISNIPKNDTRLQESPNSALAKIQPTLEIQTDTASITYPEKSKDYLLEELDLTLEPTKSAESFVATISFFRKMSIYSEFLSHYLTYMLTTNQDETETLRHIIESPLMPFYEKLNTFLNTLESQIKVSSKYDVARFCSDLSVIAILLGPKDFINLVVQTGLVNYLDKNIAQVVNTIYEQRLFEQSFSEGLLFCRTGLNLNETNSELMVTFRETTSLSNIKLTPETTLKWDGLTHTIRLLKTQTEEIPYSDYPLLAFIKIFCEPFFDQTT